MTKLSYAYVNLFLECDLKVLKMFLSLFFCYVSDGIRFLRGSGLINVEYNKATMQGHILRISHALEKGMALPNPRAGYGKQKANELIEFITLYYERFGVDDVLMIGLSSINSLMIAHLSDDLADGELIDKLKKLQEITCTKNELITKVKAGRRKVLKAELQGFLPKGPEAFFLSRSSVRQYSDEPVLVDELMRAVGIANKTPSVCNRQTCKVRIYQNKKAIEDVLSYQDGNSGFGNSASAVLVVTSDMAGFYKSGERNQGYIDGGLFSMSLVYALHSLGLGTCMLNWSQGYRSDKKFRMVADIPNNEIVIMMIAVGNLKDEYFVAESPRRYLGSIVSFKDSL